MSKKIVYKDKECVECGTIFTPTHRRSLSCSKECSEERKKARRKKWRKENPEKNRAYQKKYRDKNPERVSAYQKKYREENKEKRNAYDKMWSKENPEKRRASDKKYREANREKRRSVSRKCRENTVANSPCVIYEVKVKLPELYKYYLGETVAFNERTRSHQSRFRCGTNACGVGMQMQADYDKYGPDAFEYNIIKVLANDASKEERVREERKLIEQYRRDDKALYNRE